MLCGRRPPGAGRRQPTPSPPTTYQPRRSNAFSLRDVERWKRALLWQGLQILMVLWVMVRCEGRNKSYSATIWVFWTLSIAKAHAKFQALRRRRRAGRTYGLMKKYTKRWSPTT